MGLHEKAWSGMDILVFGKKPLIPMQIEQAFASTTPENEIKISSFEDYEAALAHCKNGNRVGFIFILEDCGNLPIHDVFTQLSRPYKEQGWPCFGVLLHEGTESIKGLQALRKEKKIISYQSYQNILNKAQTAQIVLETWQKFCSAFESTVVPDALRSTLESIACKKVSAQTLRFLERISLVIGSNLNITWLEIFALQMAPVVNAVIEVEKVALDPHQGVLQICNPLLNATAAVDYLATAKSADSLVVRFYSILLMLNQKREGGSLEACLTSLCAQAAPGTPAILRQIAKNKIKILEIANDISSRSKLKETG